MLFAACILLAAPDLISSPIRIAVLDLTVQSDQPERKHIGKGLCEMIAVELAKSKGLRVLDRAERAEALESSGPAARYVVSGDLEDSNGTVTFTLRLFDGALAEPVGSLRVTGDLADYDAMVKRLAQTLLEHVGQSAEHRAAPKRRRRSKASEEALIAFSEAIGHFDRNEDSEARIDLARAKRLDSTNEAVLLYLDKLITDTPNFKSTPNPAYLGILQYDQWFLFAHGDLPVWSLVGSYCSSSGRMVIGYSLPVGKRIGIQVDLTEESIVSTVFGENTFPDPFYSAIHQNRLVAQVSIGCAVSDYCSLGIGTSLGWQFPRLYNLDLLADSWHTESKHLFPSSFVIGFLVQNRKSTVMLDLLLRYSLGDQYGWQNEDVLLFKDPDEVEQPFTLEDWARPPILLEETLTFAIEDKGVFLTVKQANEIGLDENYHVARLIPALEVRLAKWLSVRAGFPASLYISSGSVIDKGFGCAGGFTVRISRTGWYLDADGFFSSRTARNWLHESLSRSRSSLFIGVSRKLISKAR